MSVFSERLAELIKANCLSRKEFAEKTNITESSVSFYTRAKRTPNGDTLAKMARVLNTTTDYLLGNADSSEVPRTPDRLKYLERNLGKLDDEQLKKAEVILKTVFDDVFTDEDTDIGAE